MQTQVEVLAAVDRIATDVIAPKATETDKGAFPEAAVAAFAKAGLLGLASSRDVGGLGQGPKTAVLAVERIARECGSTAMVMTMHWSAAALIEKLGTPELRKQVAQAQLATLAFSETGSRSQFWAPVSTAAKSGDTVTLNAKKSFVTSASRAGYVWSSKPLAAQGASTLWWVPPKSAGVRVTEPFDGLGLRGNDSSPVTAEAASIPAANQLGDDGKGFDHMLGVVLPWFNAMNAAASVGLMESALVRTAKHATGTQFQHAGSTVADLPTARAYIARMRIKTDAARLITYDTADAMEAGRADAVLRVLESKAAAGELANEVLDLAMRVCGGAAFRKDVAVERVFRDARASTVMAPTADVLYEFIGKAVCGLPLF
ncbi:MAG: acyl-CoA/acyl-ACP dehydrogenase [Myxococcaceae bacterium]|nr:acyl-CoA/acyl-ACP dehydrogenase [Myxococcaceae bacterium]